MRRRLPSSINNDSNMRLEGAMEILFTSSSSDPPTVPIMYLDTRSLDQFDIQLAAVHVVLHDVEVRSVEVSDRNSKQGVPVPCHEAHLNAGARRVVGLLHRDNAAQIRLLDALVADGTLAPIVVRQS